MDITAILQGFEPNASLVFPEMLLLLGLALLISAIGFKRVVYFISIGYAFSIVAMAFISPIRHPEHLNFLILLQNNLLVLWGLRLGIYLLRREYKSSYKKELDDVHDRSAQMGLGTKLLIWITVSLLYVLMFSPSLFHLLSPEPVDSPFGLGVQVLGLIIMGGGLLLEAIADRQKSRFKARHRNDYCQIGLYRWVRCPNYLGEITFWLGNWTMGIMFYHSPWAWLASLTGLLCITLIMMGSTKRLEHKQDQRYGDREDYQLYIQTVPVLFPFIPVYSLKKIKVYLE